jgi:multimeric flavodoxin WrbA
MKAIILNGSRNNENALDGIQEAIIDELTARKYNIDSFILRKLNITHCIGCFECWVKTPGVCRFNDDGIKIAKKIIKSDLLIFLTSVTFGGYSSELKKALDRIICLVSPFFTSINGETHHKPRYDNYPVLMGIGVLDQPDHNNESIFKKLVGRNAINFHAPAHVSSIVLSNQAMDEKLKAIQSLFTKIKVLK